MCYTKKTAFVNSRQWKEETSAFYVVIGQSLCRIKQYLRFSALLSTTLADVRSAD